MKSPILSIVLALSWTAVSAAQSETTLLSATGGSSQQFTLEAVGGGTAFAATGAGVTGVGAVTTANRLGAAVGFDYLRPAWASRSLQLSVPGNLIPNVAIIAPTGNLANSFAFIPVVEVNYDISSLGIGAAASAEFINLTGSVERSITTNAGTADLTSSANLTLITANLIEITKTVVLGECCEAQCLEKLGLQDDVEVFTLGTRFLAIQQNYHAALRSGNNISTADGDQSFAGIGLTGSLSSTHPLSEAWSVYCNTRASLLIGPSNRKSAVSTVTAVASPAAVNNILIENKTLLLPVGELELGVQYARPIGTTRAGGTADSVFFVRTAFVGQTFGRIGFLSASPEDLSFGDRNLYLVGFSVVAGMEW